MEPQISGFSRNEVGFVIPVVLCSHSSDVLRLNACSH